MRQKGQNRPGPCQPRRRPPPRQPLPWRFPLSPRRLTQVYSSAPKEARAAGKELLRGPAKAAPAAYRPPGPKPPLTLRPKQDRPAFVQVGPGFAVAGSGGRTGSAQTPCVCLTPRSPEFTGARTGPALRKAGPSLAARLPEPKEGFGIAAGKGQAETPSRTACRRSGAPGSAPRARRTRESRTPPFRRLSSRLSGAIGRPSCGRRR